MWDKTILAGITLMLASAALSETGPTDLGLEVRGFADITSGVPTSKGRDKVLFFSRNASGELVVSEIALVPSKGANLSPPADSAGVLRTRTANSKKKRQPDAEDLRFASAFSIPVFVLGEWSKPAMLWEIDSVSRPLRFRAIAANGISGSWQDLTN